MAKTAIVAGGTGLIGEQVLQLLLEDSRYERIIAIARKPSTLNHSKLTWLVTPLAELAAHQDALRGDDVFCCLGTTIKTAGSQTAFRAVDFDAPLQLAQLTLAQGARNYLLVSALGANRNSSIFYNRVKGEVEEAITALNWPTFHVFRPSLLLGPRKEHRSGEGAAKVFFQLFGWLVPKKYKAIQATAVARAMIHFANEPQTGTFIHESDALQSFSK